MTKTTLALTLALLVSCGDKDGDDSGLSDTASVIG